MSTLTLSEGAIYAMCAAVDGDVYDLKPVLQVTDIRLIRTQSTINSTERYFLLLSDGVHFQQGVLAMQKNDLIKNGGLHKGSIIRLLHFICNNITTKRTVIIVVELEVLQVTWPLIGEPKPYFRPGALVSPSVGQPKVNHVDVQHWNSHATGPDPTYLASEAGRLQQSKLESGAQLQSYGNNVGCGTYGALNNVKANVSRALNELIVGPSKEPEPMLSMASSRQNTRCNTPFQISPKPGPTSREKDLAVRCFKCQGFGHFQSACPNKRTVTLREAISLRNELYNEACDEEGLFLTNREEEEMAEIMAYEAQSHETSLVLRQRLHTQPELAAAEQRYQNYHTTSQWSDRCRSLINLLIINGGSCTNVASTELVSNFKSCERGLGESSLIRASRLNIHHFVSVFASIRAPPKIVPAADLMATVSLSKGSIAALCSCSGNRESDMKPVIQIADIQLVRNQNVMYGIDRYRLLLSDGVHMQQGMLGTQNNDLVRNGHLQKGSLVQLLHFICQKPGSRMLVSFS
ncbi:uncharacterized protein LOC141640778 [Silene latifolia]|uniref:uncharacterized protein LOC141640778 n=1 Tax=Silene latifolia TaxID=37657 RepID=UPI003D76C5CF